MELISGGSKRLPCNVKFDEMGNWIWICEGMVIVFPTETRHRLLSSVKGAERQAMRERLRKRRSSRSIRFQRYSWLR